MEIPNFDLNTLESNFSLVMFGMQGTGKSQAIRNIIHTVLTNKIVDEFVIISSEKTDLYSSFANVVYLKYTEEITKQFLLKQKEDKTKHRLIIFDCCLGMKCDWLKDKYLMDIIQNFKLHNVSYIFAMHSQISFSKEFENNFDYVFMFREIMCCNQLRLYDHYVTNENVTFETFKNMIMAEENYFNILILHNKTQQFYTYISVEVDFQDCVKIMQLNIKDCNAKICYDDKYYDDKSNSPFMFEYESESDKESDIDKSSINDESEEILMEILKCNEIILDKMNIFSNNKVLLQIVKSNIEIAKMTQQNVLFEFEKLNENDNQEGCKLLFEKNDINNQYLKCK